MNNLTEELIALCTGMDEADEVLDFVGDYFFDEDAYPQDVRAAYLEIKKEIKAERRAA